ncbi:hypothetical protein [Streptomyces sp. NPDC020362]|uniref:hypothetical protein n=1 Tax=unclassified Streptomyces TaxID=2593676 RepID=UPI000ABE0098
MAALLRAYQTSGTRKSALVRDRPSLTPYLRDAVDFLCLSQAVPRGEAVRLLTEPLLDRLVDMGAASESGENFELSQVRLIEHFGRLVFVSTTNTTGYGWYGRDSIGIGRHLAGARGRCLDIGSSTGCQAVLMAATTTSVQSVEIDEKPAPLFEFDEDFDTIGVNVPMMPTFGVLDMPWTGDGGADASRLLESVLRRVPLAAWGRLAANSTIPGNASGLDVEWLRKLSVDREWAVTVVPCDYESLSAESSFVWSTLGNRAIVAEDAVETVRAELAASWAANETDRMYFSTISATAGTGPSFRVASMSLDGERWSL